MLRRFPGWPAARCRYAAAPLLAAALLGACAPGAVDDQLAAGEASWPDEASTAPHGAARSVDAPAPVEGGAGGAEAGGAAVGADAATAGWHAIASGLESRELAVRDAGGALVERALAVRIDPARYAFDVAYRPGEPRSLSAWQAETGADVVVNGGYFTEAHVATGLIVAGGTPSGASYGDFAGEFAVTAAGPEVRWLAEQPHDPAEPLVAAVQAFPLLVRPDGEPAYPDDGGLPARRTVIGQDPAGRIIVAVLPLGGLTLHALSTWLAGAPELGLRIAFNLDGGASSGLLLPDGSGEPGLSAVPSVIVARAR